MNREERKLEHIQKKESKILIHYLLSIKEKERTFSIRIANNKDFESISKSLDMDWDSFVFRLKDFHRRGYISLKQIGSYESYSINLKEPLLNYRLTQKRERNEWIQFWIPVFISIIALIVAVLK